MKSHDSFRPDPDLDQMLSDHVDGLLDDADENALADLLREDAKARDYYLRYLSLHGALHWDYAEAALDPTPMRTVVETRTLLSPFGIGLAAAMICVGFVLLIASASRDVVTVEIAENAVFRDAGSFKILTEGMRLPAGTVNVDSATGFAQLRFEDGTLITLDGGSELSIAIVASRKSLRLHEGNLTAKVAPQPEDFPMRIVTPTAEIEVLGTVLSVRSEATETGLLVDEGRVRLRRLADGAQIEVPASHQSSASLDFGEQLFVEKSTIPEKEWRLRFGDPAIRVTKGIGDDSGTQAFYRSEPYVASREPDGTQVIRDGVAINGRLARLNENSRIELRYRSEVTPAIFLSLSDSSGGFGGNLEARVQDERLSPDSEGWRQATIPLSEFRILARQSNRETILESALLKKILISVQGNREIDVAEVALKR